MSPSIDTLPLLYVNDLTIEFATRRGIIQAVQHVSLAVAKGETVGQIAEGMFLSVKTVSTYRARTLEKLQLETNSDLTYYALKNGLIQ